MTPSWVTLVCTLVGADYEVSFFRLQTMIFVSWWERSAHAYDLVSRSTLISFARVTSRSVLQSRSRADAVHPVLTKDYPVTRRDESDITAAELTALQHELAVDRLLRFDDFAVAALTTLGLSMPSSCMVFAFHKTSTESYHVPPTWPKAAHRQFEHQFFIILRGLT